jgi:ubiquinone/menaquinone biosynthesis C-methylase UbiE
MKTESTLKQDEIVLHKTLAKKYGNIRETSLYYIFFNDYWLKLFKSMLPRRKFKKALDLGCGTVEFYEFITKSVGASYTGSDLSPDMLKVGAKKYPKSVLVEADAEKMPFKDGSFDFVMTRGLIHHLPNPEKGIAESYRILEKGGYFLVSEPHSNIFLYYARKLFYKKSAHFSDSHKSFRRKEFLDLVESGGFKIRKIRYWGILSFPFAFPDIIPAYKFLPLTIFKLFVHVDRYLTKIPIINSFACHIVVLAQK